MKKGIDVVEEHGEEDEGHDRFCGIFQPAGPSPHDAESGEEESRQSHGGFVDPRREEAGEDGNNESRQDGNPVFDVPQHHEVDGEVEDVGMKEAVYKMVDERTAVTETYMPESTKETDDAKRYF